MRSGWPPADASGSASAHGHAAEKSRTGTAAVHTARLPIASILIEKDWSAGDVAAISGTHVVVACQESHREGALAYTSLRVMDVAAQRLVSILPGHNSFASLKRQLCAETDKLVFSLELRANQALVFDLRTNAPELCFKDHPFAQKKKIRLPTRKDIQSLGNGHGVLGVPTSTTPMAFTWGGHGECVRAWDLRMPASHVYTLSTGNQRVRDLQWHAASASLLVVTENPRAVTRGNYHMYRFGEVVDDDSGDDVVGDSYWPSTATFGAHYFPRRYHVETHWGDSTDRILQYAFKDGFEMGRGKAAPGESVKGKQPAAD